MNKDKIKSIGWMNSLLVWYFLPLVFELLFRPLQSPPAGRHSQLPSSAPLSFRPELRALHRWRNPLLLFVTNDRQQPKQSLSITKRHISSRISVFLYSPPGSPCSFASIPWYCKIRKGEGDILALYGSSFLLIPLTAQSKVENSPPHTPKFPPRTGARALIAVTAPIRLSPYGEFRKPLTPCHTAPPIPWIE